MIFFFRALKDQWANQECLDLTVIADRRVFLDMLDQKVRTALTNISINI